MPSGRKPDYQLWVANEHGKGRAGVAWNNDDGSINIVLDTWVVLRGKGHVGSQTTIRLYPPEELRKGQEPESAKPGKFDDFEDDIPF